MDKKILAQGELKIFTVVGHIKNLAFALNSLYKGSFLLLEIFEKEDFKEKLSFIFKYY